MSVEQTFHTPNFGDEEFEIPPLTFVAAAARCGGQAVFGNQQPSSDRQSLQQRYAANPGSPRAMSGAFHAHCQGDLMAQHAMRMQTFDSHSTYINASALQTVMQPPQMVMVQQSQMMGPPQQQPMFSTINQSQLGMGLVSHRQGPGSLGHSSPPNSNHTSPALETSEDSDDSTPLAQLIGTMKRPSPEPADGPRVPKKPKSQKKKKKKDPNEPQKPVSAYALFFRDTQAAIKGQNPNASFGEVSKIVAAMWDSLDAHHKDSYKKKTETAKKEYLKALAAYRATLVSKAAVDQSDAIYGNNTMSSSPPSTISPASSPPGRMMQKASPVLTSVVDAMQPVTTGIMNINTQQIMQNQQGWHMQSPPHVTNSNSPPQMMSNHSPMMIMHQQPVQSQMSVNSQSQMNASSPTMCTSASNSPSYGQNSTSAPPTGGYSNAGCGDMVTCLRNGCSNPAIDSPDWDREYCSSECVVSHCKDVFATWVAQRQILASPYSAVK